MQDGPGFFERWEIVDPQQVEYAGDWYLYGDADGPDEGSRALYLLQGSRVSSGYNVRGNRQGAWPMLLIGCGLLPPLPRRTSLGPTYSDMQLRFRVAATLAATLATALVIRVAAMF